MTVFVMSLGTGVQNLRFVAVNILKLSVGHNLMTSLSLWHHVYATTQNDRQNLRMKWKHCSRQVHSIMLGGFVRNWAQYDTVSKTESWNLAPL